MSVSSEKRKRVLSGMRPTGKLHLGNFVGALQNWVGMQDAYECYFCVVDWHALTTDYADTSKVKENSLEVVFDWLAAGLDPDRSVIFMQSHVPAHNPVRNATPVFRLSIRRSSARPSPCGQANCRGSRSRASCDDASRL